MQSLSSLFFITITFATFPILSSNTSDSLDDHDLRSWVTVEHSTTPSAEKLLDAQLAIACKDVSIHKEILKKKIEKAKRQYKHSIKYLIKKTKHLAQEARANKQDEIIGEDKIEHPNHYKNDKNFLELLKKY